MKHSEHNESVEMLIADTLEELDGLDLLDVAEAILATLTDAGYAVVKLPSPSCTDSTRSAR